MQNAHERIPPKLNWHVRIVRMAYTDEEHDAVDVFYSGKNLIIRTKPCVPIGDEKMFNDEVFRRYFNDGDIIIPLCNVTKVEIKKYQEKKLVEPKQDEAELLS